MIPAGTGFKVFGCKKILRIGFESHGRLEVSHQAGIKAHESEFIKVFIIRNRLIFVDTNLCFAQRSGKLVGGDVGVLVITPVVSAEASCWSSAVIP